MTSSIRDFPLKAKSKISPFIYLNVTQFLGAVNDHIFKLLTVFFLIQLQGIEASPWILSTTGATFVLPFILFSGFSGTLADRYSKRNIIAWTKSLELLVMMGGWLAFFAHSPIGSYLCLFLMATQSAIFGPSKYGIVPELVESDKISRANGLLNSFTYLAIILGTFGASFLLDISQKSFLLASGFCIVLSVIGALASLKIPYTPPSGSQKKIHVNLARDVWHALCIAKKEPALLGAVFGSAFFFFLGSYAQLNMIPYAVQGLGLRDIHGGYLFILLAIGVGLGSLIVGALSGKSVELGIVPLAAAGLTLCCYLVDFLSPNLLLCLPLVVLLGLFGGIYQVPLDTYLQVASPDKQRGQVLAAAYFLSFIGVLFSSILLYLNTEVFGFAPEKGFTVMACVTLVMTVVISFQYFDYLCRFVGMVLSWLHFRTVFLGSEEVPQGPALYVCTHSDWNDTLLLLGAQRRRLRFFIEQEQEKTSWWHQLYHLLKIVQIPPIHRLRNRPSCLKEIRETLDGGSSVCIFVGRSDIKKEIEKLNRSYHFQELLAGTNYPIIPVALEKGGKEEALFFKKLYEKVRVPAIISFGEAAFY